MFKICQNGSGTFAQILYVLYNSEMSSFKLFTAPASNQLLSPGTRKNRSSMGSPRSRANSPAKDGRNTPLDDEN